MIFPFKAILIFMLSILADCFAQDSVTISKIKALNEKAENFLLKEKSLSSYYTIDNNGISIYESPEHKIKGMHEFYVNVNKIEEFKLFLRNSSFAQQADMYKRGSYDNSVQEKINDSKISVSIPNNSKANTIKNLQGLRIAIDPGHIAGNMEMGNIEKKCLTFKCFGPDGTVDSIAIAEGMITFATAQLLKEKLEREGAEVFMTRTFNNSSAFGITFDEWLKTDYIKTVDSLYKTGKLSLSQKQFFLSSKASKRDKFRVIFKDIELAKRAELINNYKPDFTIIIHYNVDENNTGWTKPAGKNFNMAFVGGAFMKNDLSSPEKRFEFFRLLISDDIEESIELSSAVIKNFEKKLNVKTATVKDALYLMEGCLLTDEPGVYCRNLQLTRYIHGPLVYGETLYQDNIGECVRLNKELDKTKNERVQQVAEAYFQGVLSYVKNKH